MPNKKALLIRFTNEGNFTFNGRTIVVAEEPDEFDKHGFEYKLARYFGAAKVSILFIDVLDDRTRRDTIITVGHFNYEAFTEIVDLIY